MKTFATSQPLNQSTLPSDFCLTRKTHLQLMTSCLVEEGIRDHVLFLISASISSRMASLNSLDFAAYL